MPHPVRYFSRPTDVIAWGIDAAMLEDVASGVSYSLRGAGNDGAAYISVCDLLFAFEFTDNNLLQFNMFDL